eukprot:scaffold393745_cov54-Prasinocladus_malaysianus.AAC.1
MGVFKTVKRFTAMRKTCGVPHHSFFARLQPLKCTHALTEPGCVLLYRLGVVPLEVSDSGGRRRLRRFGRVYLPHGSRQGLKLAEILSACHVHADERLHGPWAASRDEYCVPGL